MRRTLGSLLITTLMLSACQLANTPLGAGKRIGTASKPTTTAGVVSPGGGNITSPSGGNVVAPGGDNDKLPLAELIGRVQMDATYVVAAGGGNVIAPGGGNVIAPGGGNVIAPGGGNVIAPGGGNVIAAGGGNLIQVGGQVIAAGGGNVIAPGGGNVIAPGGGNVIAPGGGNYQLLAIEVPFGQMLPAQGMVAVPISLLTGKPLGDAVFTDSTGQFKIHIPASEQGNVRIVTAVPAKTKDDPLLTNTRLQYEVLMQAGASGDTSVDEDTALVYHYIRISFAGRLYDLLSEDNQTNWGNAVESWAKLGDNALIKGILDELYNAMVKAGTAKKPEDVRRKMAQDMADVVMHSVKLDEAMVDATQPDWHPVHDEKAVDALIEIMRLVRVGANQKLAGNAHYFDTAPYVTAANKDRASNPWKIVKASDLGDFVVNTYLSANNEDLLLASGDVFADVGVDRSNAARLKAAEFGMLRKVGMTMFMDADAKKAMYDKINGK